MSKTVTKVFLIIGALVACFIVWTLVFGKTGGLKTAYNAMAEQINTGFQNLTGGTTNVIPTWGTTDGTTAVEDNGNAATLGSGATSK